MNTKFRAIGFILVVVAVLGSTPAWLGPYYLSIVTATLFFVALTSAWNIVGGMTGQFSLGHSLFVALGGTGVASLVALHGWNPWASLLTAAVGSAIVAIGISLLMFRTVLPHLSFAMVTLALAEVGLLLVISTDALGAASGVVWARDDGFGLDSPEASLWAALGASVVVVAISWLLLRSRLGYYFRATRDDEDAAAAIGVNLFRIKTIALVISAVLTSLVASLYANYLVFVDPYQFASPVLSISIILYAVVGGLGTVRGPVLGAGLLFPLAEILRGEFGELAGLHLVVFGVVIVVVVLYAPTGLSGLIERFQPGRPPSQPVNARPQNESSQPTHTLEKE
ncbi:branched-chain amino acid ABC transporter permease [Nocardioides sp. CF8]|uniref:branched-chain amino acid ABC transporter permease n=1 Tax=Nocardioides sp. CF8 TaxID=110319 RepID=UPI00041F7A9E|nr:branched-chain amino acid ABC transporter permease [Nocardioides sp. CF8]